MSTDGYSDRTDEEKEQKEKIQGADLMISWLHCFDWQVSAAWSAAQHKKQHLRRKQSIFNWKTVVNSGSKLFPQWERGKQWQI